MRKLTLLFVFLLLSVFFVKAGTIEIVSIDSVLMVSPYISEAKAKCIFKNASNETKSFKLKVVATKIDEGLDLSFCWGPICYPPLSENDPFEPSDLITLAPGEISGPNEFYFTFVPNGYFGEAVAVAVLFDNANPTDSLLLTFRFVSQTLGVDELNHASYRKAIILDNLDELENFGFELSKTTIFDLFGKIIVDKNTFLKIRDFTLQSGIYLALQNSQKSIIFIKMK